MRVIIYDHMSMLAAVLTIVLALVVRRCVAAVRRRLEELQYVERAFMLFDGGCTMCNGFVDFCIAREPTSLKVAGLESDTGRWLCRVHGVALPPSSFVYIEELAANPQTFPVPCCKVYQKSDAALHSLSALRSPWCWVLMMAFEPVPSAIRDCIYDLGWCYRRTIFGTTTCRRRSEKHDLEGAGRLHTCDVSRERGAVLGGCAGGGGGDDDEARSTNILSRDIVVFDAGMMRRSGAVQPQQPPPVVERDELVLCRRLSLEAAERLDGVVLASEARERWAPFFVVCEAIARHAVRARRSGSAASALAESFVRDAFGGCISPRAQVVIEPLREDGARSGCSRRSEGGGEGDTMAHWRKLIEWCDSQPVLLRDCLSWVTIEREIEDLSARKELPVPARKMLRLALTLTQEGSLVGVCAVGSR